MNSDFWQTAEATPPVMNHGLSTVWPPLQLVPASAHKSTEVFTLARSKHAAVIKVQMCYTTQCQSDSTVIGRRQFLRDVEYATNKAGQSTVALNTTPVRHCFSMSQWLLMFSQLNQSYSHSKEARANCSRFTNNFSGLCNSSPITILLGRANMKISS